MALTNLKRLCKDNQKFSFSRIREKNYFNFRVLPSDLLDLYLQLRKLIGLSPRPNKKKSITIDNLTKIIKSESIQIKIQEIDSKSCIWEIY